VAGVALLTVSAWSITRLEVGVYALSWFPGNDPVVADTLRADEYLGGSSSLEFLVSAPDGGLADPTILNKLHGFERWLEHDIPGVTRAFSIADLQRELPIPPDPPGAPAPDPKTMVELQYHAFSDAHDRDLRRLVQPDHSLGRITTRVRLDQSTFLVHHFGEIEEKLSREINHDGLQVEMTGFARLMGKMEDYLIASQIKSFALAFGVITLMMVGLLHSWRLGLFAMIPNLIPVVIGLGAMPLLGITLNPGTIMIGAIALGLVVDDTVHFLVALRRQLSETKNLDAAITRTVQEAGRPIVLTSLILMGGFAILTCGSFNPNIQFGAISALVIGLALLADLLLLPAALRLTRPNL